jgi:hypothetical protein
MLITATRRVVIARPLFNVNALLNTLNGSSTKYWPTFVVGAFVLLSLALVYY